MLESKPIIQQISSDTIQLGKQIYASERATVFHGTWYGHDIAVKRFDKTKQRGNFEQSFQKTVEAMGKYRFPTIINYYGVSLNANDYAMVMEWMPKGSLNDVLHNPSETFAWNPVRWQVAIDTAAGLSYLHEQGAVHGDLSSFSIMLDMNYRAKLTLNSKEGLGAVRWRAPELFKRGATTNPASEIYSFGMVLWEITTQSKPYASDEDDAAVGSYIKDNEKETVPETSPKAFADSINACWNEIDKRPVASQILKWLSEAKPPIEMPPVKMIEPEVASKSVPTSVPAIFATEKTPNNVLPNPIPKTIVPPANPLQISYIEKLLPMLLKERNTAGLINIKNLVPEQLMFDIIDALLNAMTNEDNAIATTAHVLSEFADNIPKISQTKVLRVIISTMITIKGKTIRGYSNSLGGTKDQILERLALIFAKLNRIISDDFKPSVATTILTCIPQKAAEILEKIWPNHSDLIDILLQLIANKDSNSLSAMNILTRFKDYAQFFVAELNLNVFKYKPPGFYLYRQADLTTNTDKIFAHVVYKTTSELPSYLLPDRYRRAPLRLPVTTVVTNGRIQKIYQYDSHYTTDSSNFIHTETLNLSQLATEKGSLALLDGLHPVQEPSETYFNEELVALIKSNCDLEQLQDRSILRKKSQDIIPVLIAALTAGEFQVRERVAQTLCYMKEIIPASKSVEIIRLLVNEQNFFIDEAVILQQYFRNLPEIRAMALERTIVQLSHSAISRFKLEETEEKSRTIFKKYTSALIRFKAGIPETHYVQIIDALLTTLKKNALFDESICVAIIALQEYIPASFTTALFNTLIDIIKARQYKGLEQISMLCAELQSLIPDTMKQAIIDALLSAINAGEVSKSLGKLMIPDTMKPLVFQFLLSAINMENEDTQGDLIESLGTLIDFMTIEYQTLLVDKLLNKIKEVIDNDTCLGAFIACSIYKVLGQCYRFVSNELGLKIVEGLMMEGLDNFHQTDVDDSLPSRCYAVEALVKFKMIMPNNFKEELLDTLLNRGAEKSNLKSKERAYYLDALVDLSTVLSQEQKLAIATALIEVMKYLRSEDSYWEIYFILNLLPKLKDLSGVEIKMDWKLLSPMLRNIVECKRGLTEETFRPGVNYVITSLIAVMQQELSKDSDDILDELQYFFKAAGKLLSDTQQATLIPLLMDKINTSFDVRFVEMLLTLKRSVSEKDKDALVQFLFSQIKQHFDVNLARGLMIWKDFLSGAEKRQLANALVENFQTNVASNLRMAQELGNLSKDIIPIVLKPVLRALENLNHSVRLAAIEALVRFNVTIPTSKHEQVIKELLMALTDEDYDVRGCAAKALVQLNAFNVAIPTSEHKQVIENLLIALTDENHAVRGSAAKALVQLNVLVPADMLDQLHRALLKSIEGQYHPDVANTLVIFKASIKDILIPQIITVLINAAIIKEEEKNIVNARKTIKNIGCNEHAIMMLLAFKEYFTGEIVPRILPIIEEVLKKHPEGSPYDRGQTENLKRNVIKTLLELNKQASTKDFSVEMLSVIEKVWFDLDTGTKRETIKILTALNLSSSKLIQHFCKWLDRPYTDDVPRVSAEVKEALAHFGINDSGTIETLHRQIRNSMSDADAAAYLLGYVIVPLPEVVISDLFNTLGKYPNASFALGRASRYQPDIIDKLFEKLNEKDIKPEVRAIILQSLSIGLQAMVVVVQDKQDNQAHGNNRNLLLAQPTPSLNPENPSAGSVLEMRMNK